MMPNKIWAILAIVLAITGLITGLIAYDKYRLQQQYDAGFNEATSNMLKSVNAALEAERKLQKDKQEKIDELAQEKYDKERAINATLNRNLDKLRKRASRYKEQSNSNVKACEGQTGAALSYQDGRFLIGEAARADEIRNGLDICQRYIDVNSNDKQDN